MLERALRNDARLLLRAAAATSKLSLAVAPEPDWLRLPSLSVAAVALRVHGDASTPPQSPVCAGTDTDIAELIGSKQYEPAYVNVLRGVCKGEAVLHVRTRPPDVPLTFTLTRVRSAFEIVFGLDDAGYAQPFWLDVDCGALPVGCALLHRKPVLHTFRAQLLRELLVPAGVATFTKASRLAVRQDGALLATTTSLCSDYDCVLLQTVTNVQVASAVTVEGASFMGCAFTAAHTLLVCDATHHMLYDMDSAGAVQRQVAVRHPCCVAVHGCRIAVGCMATPCLLRMLCGTTLGTQFDAAPRDSVYVALSSVAFTPDGAHVGGVDHAQTLHVFCAVTGAHLRRILLFSSNTVTCMCSGFAADELLVLLTQPGAQRNCIVAARVTDAAQLLDTADGVRAAAVLPPPADLRGVVSIAATHDQLWLQRASGFSVWA